MSVPEKLANLKRARKAHNDDCLFCAVKDTAIDGVIQLFADQQALIEQLVEALVKVKSRYVEPCELSAAWFIKPELIYVDVNAALAAAGKQKIKEEGKEASKEGHGVGRADNCSNN